jgi:hypothetical protein
LWDLDITSEEEERYIQKAAEVIHKYGMETAAILLLETSKPMIYIGGEMGRFFASPFLHVLGEETGLTGKKLLLIFEKRENIEKLIQTLEKMAENDAEQRKKIKEKKEKERETKKEKHKKEGWRRFLPF